MSCSELKRLVASGRSTMELKTLLFRHRWVSLTRVSPTALSREHDVSLK